VASSALLEVAGVVGCRILGRLNRFVVEVEALGERVLAHNTNTGRLSDVLTPGRRGYCRPLTGSRRTRYRLFAVEYSGGYAVIDTSMQEEAFARAVNAKLLPWLRGCRVEQRRPRLGGSLLDFKLSCDGRDVYVETKSAVLRGPQGLAMYPDCPTMRGRRHIKLLARYARQGLQVALVFIAAFPGARGFTPNPEGDPEIPGLLLEAREAGVEIRAIGLDYKPDLGVRLYNPDLPVILGKPRI